MQNVKQYSVRPPCETVEQFVYLVLFSLSILGAIYVRAHAHTHTLTYTCDRNDHQQCSMTCQYSTYASVSNLFTCDFSIFHILHRVKRPVSFDNQLAQRRTKVLCPAHFRDIFQELQHVIYHCGQLCSSVVYQKKKQEEEEK